MKALRMSCLAAALVGLAACSAGDAPSTEPLSEADDALNFDGQTEERATEVETGTNAEALRRRPGARRRPGGGRPPQDPCAAVRCAAGTHCEAVGRRALCVPDEPEPVNPCAAVLCIEGTVCEVIDGQGVCVGDVPPPEEDPCALVDCPPERPVCEVRDGEAVCVAAAPSGPFCGGIAGFACPGAGTCQDDPSDDCDPNAGGADCGGICTCDNVLLLCVEGTVFDASPEVCACVPPPEEDPCALVDCPPERPVCEVRDGEAVCVAAAPSGPFCGGIAGFACPGAGTCQDDPSDDCDPNAGGADCGGICTCDNVLLLCVEGTVFDSSPEVCACVPEPEPVDPCATVLCAPGTRCVARGDEAHCVPRGRQCAHAR